MTNRQPTPDPATLSELTPFDTSRLLLLAWLAAEDEVGRRAALALFDHQATAGLAEHYLALAEAGPAYGGDRRAESGVQRALLELASELAERDGAWLVAGQAAIGLVPLCLAERRVHQAQATLERAFAALGLEPALLIPLEALVIRLTREPVRSRPGARLEVLPVLRAWRTCCRGLGDRLAMGEATFRLGEALLAAGDPASCDILAEADALFAEMADDDGQVRTKVKRLGASLQVIDLQAAETLAGELVVLRGRITDPDLIALLDDPALEL